MVPKMAPSPLPLSALTPASPSLTLESALSCAVDTASPSYSWNELGHWSGPQPGFRASHPQIYPPFDSAGAIRLPCATFRSSTLQLDDRLSLPDGSGLVGHNSSGRDKSFIKRESSDESMSPLNSSSSSSSSPLQYLDSLEQTICTLKMEQTPQIAKKRRRLPLSCEQCRKRKVKCDRSDPCENCVRSKVECKYADDPRTAHLLHHHSVFNKSESASSSRRHHERRGSSSQNPLSPASPSSLDSPELVRELVERIKRMEKELADKVHTSASPASGGPASRRPSDLGGMGIMGTSNHVKGVFLNTRYFGQSHWINCANQLKPVLNIIEEHNRQRTSDITHLLDKCNAACREIKTREQLQLPIIKDLLGYVPVREIADQLVHAYLRTFETIYRVLIVPQFLEEYELYWMDPSAANQSFVTKLLLIMAIGSTFQLGGDSTELRESALQWIFVAHSWLTTPYEKLHLTLEGIQIHCLLLIARQTANIGGDMVWLSAGALLTKAMHMGLHIDPEWLETPVKTNDCTQLRRRLWSTVVELVLQSSMDCGALPLLNTQSFECRPPLNVDDMFITDPVVLDSPPDQFTDSSLQILLANSLSIRLEIAAFVNDFRADNTTYDKTIQLSERLISTLAANATLLKTWDQNAASPPTSFQIKMLEILTHRFLLTLHYPYATLAKTDRTFYYSRKAGLETSMLLLSYDEVSPYDDYVRLRVLGGAVFKNVPLLATMFVREELVDQLENDMYAQHTSLAQQSRLQLRQVVEDYVELTAARIRNGEANVKGNILAAAVLAQIDAILSGGLADVESAIITAVRGALEASYRMLRSRLDSTPSVGVLSPMDSSASQLGPTGSTPGGEWSSLENINDWFSSDYQNSMTWLQ